MYVPFKESLLIDIGLVLLFIVIGFIIYAVIHEMGTFFRPKQDKKNETQGCFGCGFKFIVLLSALWISFTFIGFATYIQTFRRIPDNQLIAEIKYEKMNFDDRAQSITINEYSAATPMKFDCSGDECFIEGEILTFKSWVALFSGSKSMYRFTQISAAPDNEVYYDSQAGTKIHLISDEINPRWGWLYKFGSKVPLFQVEKDTIIHSPEFDSIVVIKATREGMTIE